MNASLILLLLLIPLGLAVVLILFIHFGYRAPRIAEVGSPADQGIDYETVSIPTRHHKWLFGWWLPVEGASDSIVMVHGWGGNSEMMLPLALPLYRSGLNILLIDARNHGQSDVDGVSSMPRFAEDVESAVEWLRLNHPRQSRKIGLLGHSVGAAAVLLAAAELAGTGDGASPVGAVIAIASFAHPRKVMRRSLLAFHVPRWLHPMLLAYVQWAIGRRFDEIAPVNTVCRIDAPVLLVHGDRDSTVPIDDTHEIMKSCPRALRQLLVVPGAGHDSVEAIRQHEQALIHFLAEQGFAIKPFSSTG